MTDPTPEQVARELRWATYGVPGMRVVIAVESAADLIELQAKRIAELGAEWETRDRRANTYERERDALLVERDAEHNRAVVAEARWRNAVDDLKAARSKLDAVRTKASTLEIVKSQRDAAHAALANAWDEGAEHGATEGCKYRVTEGNSCPANPYRPIPERGER